MEGLAVLFVGEILLETGRLFLLEFIYQMCELFSVHVHLYFLTRNGGEKYHTNSSNHIP